MDGADNFAALSEKPRSLSPAQRLPLIVLAEIFPLSVPTSPITLSQVCRAWRAASQWKASLWANIQVDLSNSRAAEKALHFISLSGQSVPLAIEIRRSSSMVISDRRNQESIMALAVVLKMSAGRWRRFDFTSSAIDATVFFAHCQGTTPLLQHLAVNLHSTAALPENAINIPFSPLPNSAPLSLILTEPNHVIPWPASWSICSFDITIGYGLQTRDLVEILRNLPMLEDLSVAALKNDPRILTEQTILPPLLMDNLRLLKLRAISNLYILETLRTPQLVTFSAQDFRWSDSVEYIAAFLGESHLLRRITLAGVPYKPQASETFPPIDLPTATHLDISRAPNIFLEALSAPLASQIVLSSVGVVPARDFLSSCDNLTELKLRILSYPPKDAQFVSHFFPGQVTSLNIDHSAIKLLGTTALSGLRSLTVLKTRSKDRTYPQIGSVLGDCLEMSFSPPLRHMHLQQLNLSTGGFLYCLGQMNSMEEMELVECLTTSAIWTKMADITALPRLRSLKVVECSTTNPSDLLRMVRTRNADAAVPPNAVATLKVYVRFREDAGDVARDTLDELKVGFFRYCTRKERG
ncbi:hypothetical protein BOTBODRAFT_32929 [Botryobasidium botryosum FD-172 SS1]|uniref:F-box domain-containing protein n=1 Tax=Botryobasidium botryosum (strain FD-172 SS1) TaxID=930990 RepID=A0A067MRB7_BOTB1|nr:hypothetical protein BOTBODRAFT_32929 [Botryobasidium botryosum FD-172 SS1]